MNLKTRSIAFERLTLASLLIGLVIVLIQTDGLWRLDRVVYDAHLRLWSDPAPDDIVIIAIDEASLRTYGRWPWPRSLHAKLLDILSEEDIKAVSFDIIFAEPDLQNPVSDQQLSKAIKNNGRVILPVLMEQTRQHEQPIETLPLPELATHAAGLGHIHVELDPDGIARSLFLYEGLGKAVWPHMSIAMLNIAGIKENLPVNTGSRKNISPMMWQRNHNMLIPFQGPPDHFRVISYQQVMQKEFLPGTFKDTFVLIGTTAAGLGDSIPTPVSGFNHLMSGVELNANILNALRNNQKITALGKPWKIILSGLIALLSVYLFQNKTPRTNFFITAAVLLACIGMSTILLRGFQTWFPPTAAFLAVTLSYLLWSLLRLERTMRYLREELNRLHKQKTTLQSIDKITLKETIDFYSQLLPLNGWLLLGENKKLMDQHDSNGLNLPEDVPTNRWLFEDQACWAKIYINDKPGTLGLKWDSPTPPDSQQLKILEAISLHSETDDIQTGIADKDIDLRIAQVQQAGKRLRELSHFIDDSIANMADGILVTDLRGKIVLANKKSVKYLHAEHFAQLSGAAVMPFLSRLTLKQENTWPELLHQVIITNEPAQTEATTKTKEDVLVQISAMHHKPNTVQGIVFNFSNISQLKASERKRNELLNFLSHDLRAPLVSMSALLELARNSKTQDELESILTRIESNTHRTINLTQQFLQLSRAESVEHLVFTEVDMVAITQNAVDHLWGQTKAAKIIIEQTTSIDEAWLMGNGELLERAIINLLENAIKYSPTRTTITVNLRMIENELRCCIRDFGPGIAQTDLPNIFNRFYRVENKTTPDFQGAGLGLALVDTVAKRHRGRVEVSSETGQGSTFCFIVPIQASSHPYVSS